MNPNNLLDLPLTNEEYVALKGNRCPLCCSAALEGKSFEIVGRHAYQDVRCLDCDSSWTDIYNLHAYREHSTLEGNTLFVDLK